MEWPFNKARRVRGGDRDWRNDLSGAVWSPDGLWIVRDKAATHELWRFQNNEWEAFVIEGGPDDLDLEGVTVDSQGRLIGLNEAGPSVVLLTVTAPGVVTIEAEWGLAQIPHASRDGLGPEGIAALPHNKFMVGHQDGGHLFGFMLADAAPMAPLLSISYTAGIDTSALEVEPETGRLWVWHGGPEDDPRSNWLEIGQLQNQGRWVRFCAEERYVWPKSKENIEGLAVSSCVDGERQVWLTTDGGKRKALRSFTMSCGA